MRNEIHPTITSFIIRFVQENDAEPSPDLHWRGSIRHIQTDQECTFAHWGEALDFMQDFLPSNTFDQKPHP